MKTVFLFVITVMLLNSCTPIPVEEAEEILIRKINPSNKYVIGYTDGLRAGSFEYTPYSSHTFYLDSIGLVTGFGWGFGGGESIDIIANDSTYQIFGSSFGCGLFESYSFKTLHQKLILTEHPSNNTDTIIGYLEYNGIQDVLKMKEIFRKYEADLKKYYGISLTYFDSLQPATLSVIGSFIAPKCKHDADSELDPHKLLIECLKCLHCDK